MFRACGGGSTVQTMQKDFDSIIVCFFMFYEPVFLGYYSHFPSCLYPFTSYSYSCKILQPCVETTVWMHSDSILSSTGATLMKTVIKIIVNNKWWFFINYFRFGLDRQLYENQPLWSKSAKDYVENYTNFRPLLIHHLCMMVY